MGIIGVGNMGLAMALRLRELGAAVHVRDIDPAREALAVRAGARAAATPAELAGRCGVAIVAVVDAAQSEAVLFGADGAVAALPAGASVLLCATIAPASTEALAERLAAAGIDAIDAPMSGGPARARAGTMSLMVACSDAAFERRRGLLEALAARCFASARSRATARGPSSSTTCSPRSTSPEPRRRWRWPSDSASTARRCST